MEAAIKTLCIMTNNKNISDEMLTSFLNENISVLLDKPPYAPNINYDLCSIDNIGYRIKITMFYINYAKLFKLNW